MNIKQIKMIEARNKQKLLAHFPALTEETGIYILKREEAGFRYAYIGQAKHILTRLAQHLIGYQHIDLSLKKHKLFSSKNLTGWKIDFVICSESELDIKEQEYITLYANKGFQLRNKTSGGQGEGKFGINENKPRMGYYDGLKQGYINAQKTVARLFGKNLICIINGDTNKNKEKTLQKFKEFIGIADNVKESSSNIVEILSKNN